MQEIIRTLAWTFIHSLWQGLIAALLAALIISSTRRATARLRYNLLGIVLMIFLAGTLVTFLWQWNIESKAVTAFSFAIREDISVISNSPGLLDQFVAQVDANSRIVVLLWSIFFILGCARMMVGLAGVNRLRHYKTHPAGEAWLAKLEELRMLTGIRRSVSILQSELVKVPVALGVFKPVILVPLGLLSQLPAEQIETILLHELAHIRRKDYLVNLLQHLAETIFFFNPAVRWISSLLRQEREACCDDMVVAHYGQKHNYLDALVSFQEYSLNQSAFAMGISTQRHYLLNRVRRLMTARNKGMNIFEKSAIGVGLILFSAFSFVTRDQEEKQPLVIQQPVAAVSPAPLASPDPAVVKKIKMVQRPSEVKMDTVPAGKNVKGKDGKPKSKEEWEKTRDKADAKLQEIADIKEDIGKKKESIGAKKEALKVSNEKEKKEVTAALERNRAELEKKRAFLETKRVEWDRLKKEAAKAKETEKEEESEDRKENKKESEKEKIKETQHEIKKVTSYRRESDRVAHLRADSIKRTAIARNTALKNSLSRREITARKTQIFSGRKSVLFKVKPLPLKKENSDDSPDTPKSKISPKQPAPKTQPPARDR